MCVIFIFLMRGDGEGGLLSVFESSFVKWRPGLPLSLIFCSKKRKQNVMKSERGEREGRKGSPEDISMDCEGVIVFGSQGVRESGNYVVPVPAIPSLMCFHFGLAV